MPTLTPIPLAAQREERWANGAGSTRVILREPDTATWQVRISVARVDAEGPFSELPDTRRTLVPLDAPMTLQFADGSQRHARRMQALQFAGAPAPQGRLPEGPTRDFNLMLRADARGEAFARTLVGPMLLPTRADTGWLVWLDSGQAQLRVGDTTPLVLGPGDAARLAAGGEPSVRVVIEGGGEILLVKLYA